MKKGEYLVKKCVICGIEKRKSIDNFKKYAYKTNGDTYHSVCRECEEKINEQEEVKEWKGNLLKCRDCFEFLPLDQFTKSKTHSISRKKHAYICANCKTKRRKEVFKRYSEEIKILKVLQSRYLSARKRAADRNIEFSITKKDLKDLYDKQNGLCNISKIKMTYTTFERRKPFNISLDRIDSTKGYTKDNIQLVCMAVNQLKSDFDMDIIYKICESIIENKH